MVSVSSLAPFQLYAFTTTHQHRKCFVIVLAMIRTIAIKKELPRRPEENIPSNSRHGDVLWSLLEGCWEFEPKKRPSAAEVAKIMSGIAREGLIPGQTGSEGPAQVASTSGQPAESGDVE
ncbi:hypothetical protein FS749_001593 [Ceratobasidium sp. UAMH 11750]|nr:hypothetical protein FS749_001593 [Ceratobasidium sp. UAMH 11750]